MSKRRGERQTAKSSLAVQNLNPHLSGNSEFSELQELVVDALRQYGEMEPGTVLGQVQTMMIDFANEVIEDILSHPYHDGSIIRYYETPAQSREVPDLIMKYGLMYRYAKQQSSEKEDQFKEDYYAKLNQLMFRKAFGPNAMAHPLKLQRVDGKLGE